MTDYIPREPALTAMNGDIDVTGMENGESIYKYLKAVVDKLKRIPAADVVEVVRCKDCKHMRTCYSEVFMTNAKQTRDIFEPIDFCSFGERREDG